jgi:hypothetical protein
MHIFSDIRKYVVAEEERPKPAGRQAICFIATPSKQEKPPAEGDF